MIQHKKHYNNDAERNLRFEIFKKNMEYVNEFNARKDKTYTLKMNKFGDLTNEEFVSKYIKSNLNINPMKVSTVSNPSPLELPVSYDWRTQGVVPPVMNEGECADVVSIVGLELSEAVCAINATKFTLLSLQQILDCNSGCSGSDFETTFKYLETYGLESAASYPDTQIPGPCLYNKSAVVYNLKHINKVQTGNETAMAYNLVSYGPLIAAIDASHLNFQLYDGGVYYESTCSSTNLDTAVLVVGYGTLGNSEYWICENSWGVSWGLQGYILMSRNRNNNCGIATDTYYGEI